MLTRRRLLLALASAAAVIAAGLSLTQLSKPFHKQDEVGSIVKAERRIKLPEPSYESGVSIEKAILLRRSRREYRDEPITLRQLSQLLWAAQGITESRYGFRTVPSAGATYPLEVYVVVKSGGVKGLEAGIYHYLPKTHEIELVKLGDYSRELMKASLDQEWVGAAPINLVINAVYERTTRHYGDRGVRYVHMEVGHLGQNIYLQCISLGLACVVVGAFYDEEVKRIVGGVGEPLYVIPVAVPVEPWKL